jgi:hypothetical protein
MNLAVEPVRIDSEVAFHQSSNGKITGAKRPRRTSAPRNPPAVIDGTTVLCSFEITSNEVSIRMITDLMELRMPKGQHHVAA